ncbi:hypothetical protein M5689_012540 [Euphorbia peplus]|nr:hypothetical protein M5689_012540 [Euphorbia peplus]
MALLVPESMSQHQQSDDHNLEKLEVSSELHLKSSSQSLDKNVVLKRIRHHKNLNKFRNAFHSLLIGSSSSARWSDPEDAFSSP